MGAVKGRNPISIPAPCHRMIEISGYLTGFASSLKAKEGLLRVVNVGVTSSVAVVGSIVHNKSTQCVNEVREEQAALEKDKKLSSKTRT